MIELIERLDKYWFYARNADLEMTEGAVPARDLRIVKRLPGESTVSGFEEGPCAVATYTFQGRKSYRMCTPSKDLSQVSHQQCVLLAVVRLFRDNG